MKVWSVSIRWFIAILFLYHTGFSQEKISIDYTESTVSRLIKNDSIVEARMLLDSVYNIGKNSVNKEFLVLYNYKYGLIFNSSGRYKEALAYLTNAQKISNKLLDKPYESGILMMILRVYRESHMHKELDSLYPIAVRRNKQNNDIRSFFNHTDYVISCMNRGQYKNVIRTTEQVLSDLDQVDFSKQSPRVQLSANKVLRNELKLYLAIALIEEKKEYKKSYKLLNQLETDSLFFVKRERDEYLRLIKQYKARYFYEYDKNIDSVSYYQALSNKYEEIYIRKLKERASNADTFIYEIAKNKSDIEQLSVINNKNVQLKKNYIQISFLIGFLLVLAIIFSVYVYKSNTHKNRINRELKEKNTELLAVDEERNQFFSVISHELRTPIYTIQGLVEVMEDAKNESQRKEFLKTLKFSNNHLSGLVNNALEYSKFRLGNVRLNKDAFFLDEMLLEICNSFAHQLSQSNTELHVNISKDVETNVIGDRLKLSQIFINLISNAIKFTSNGNIWLNVIRIANTKNKTKLHFEVKDDGIGIKKELQSDVFNGFKGIQHIDKHNGGSGLGLYIVKRFIEDLYKSTITLESEQNKGTTFSFEIELERNLEKKSPPSMVKDEDYKNVLKGYNMLVVDDNTINLMITKKILENAGAVCITANNGIEAVTLVQENSFDIVFMDIHMPEQDGLETTKKIRAFNEDVIIMALTAVDLENMVTQIYKSGMNGIVTKPYKQSDLFQKILSFTKSKK
ncbi:response regulator [Aquimarina sediminis]|uniref:response regulator n=1 Tax=Aquimarina sediminis TaxID=2070536 RepID=UPI0013E8A345|nr:response regulator [Aquimarina sediminis]